MAARVLVVDDERYVRRLIRDSLTREGYEVETAESGTEALRMLRENPCDVVIADVVMPGMDGLDLLKRLKRDHPEVGVVILTGKPLRHDLSEFLLAGADEFLTKPFQIPVLREAVERVLAEHGG